MNKREISLLFARNYGLTNAKAVEYVDGVLATLEEGLLTDGKVTLTGFGTLSLSTRKGFDGQHPRTGEAISVPSVTVPVFKVGKGLKARINGA